jgi:hypothetical protein
MPKVKPQNQEESQQKKIALWRQHKVALRATRGFHPELRVYIDWDGMGVYHNRHDMLSHVDADDMNPQTIQAALDEAKAKAEEIEAREELAEFEAAQIEDQIAAAEAFRDRGWA